MNRFSLFWEIACTRATVVSGAKVAVVVGVILNLINQGDLLVQGAFAGVHWPKFVLTFFVPYGVSVYSATVVRMRFEPGTKAPVDVQLACSSCGDEEIRVQRGESIPECSRCHGATAWRGA